MKRFTLRKILTALLGCLLISAIGSCGKQEHQDKPRSIMDQIRQDAREDQRVADQIATWQANGEEGAEPGQPGQRGQQGRPNQQPGQQGAHQGNQARQPDQQGRPQQPQQAEPQQPRYQPSKPIYVLAAGEIMIGFTGGQMTLPGVTRAKESAQALAREVLAVVKADPNRFEEMARKNSDLPSKDRGGFSGIWTVGTRPPQIEQLLMGLPVGGVTDLLETPVGFLILQRRALVHPAAVAGEEILIRFRGAMEAPENVTRSKDEAMARTMEALGILQQQPERFEELVRLYSEGANIGQGGLIDNTMPDEQKQYWWYKGERLQDLGAQPSVRVQIVDILRDQLEKLQLGQVMDKPILSPVGYHIVRRVEPQLPTYYAAAVIQVLHKELNGAPAEFPDKAQAQAAALQIAAQLKQHPETFPQLMTQLSQQGRWAQGGPLGSWIKGDPRLARFEPLLDPLQVGQVSDPLDTSIGFLILLREPLDESGVLQPGRSDG